MANTQLKFPRRMEAGATELPKRAQMSSLIGGWALLLLALLVSRVPLLPKYLVTFDAINFALAIQHFDPSLHQPQPPGYPFFVFFLRAIAAFGSTTESVFATAGILSSWVVLILVQRLGALLSLVK